MSSEYIKGKCMQMCPESEIKMRQKEGMLHVLEMDTKTITNRRPRADPNRIIKCFSRSAAGQKMPKPEELRPAPVLKMTVEYLLNNVVLAIHVRWDIIYNFIMDRLRAVRQDIVIQSLSPFDSVEILEPIVRFHCYSAYRLCTEHIDIFDPVINTTHLLDCLKRILVCYDMFERIDESNSDFYKSRPEMESLYLLLNLGDTIALRRVLGLLKKWRTNPLINYSFLISLAWYHKNFIRVCKMLQSLPPLLFAVSVLHLPVIRRKTFEIMSIGYNSKVLTYPLDKLTVMLLYNNKDEIINDVNLLELQTDGDTVKFNKTAFNVSQKNLPLLHVSLVENILSKEKLPKLLLMPHNNLNEI